MSWEVIVSKNLKGWQRVAEAFDDDDDDDADDADDFGLTTNSPKSDMMSIVK